MARSSAAERVKRVGGATCTGHGVDSEDMSLITGRRRSKVMPRDALSICEISDVLLLFLFRVL